MYIHADGSGISWSHSWSDGKLSAVRDWHEPTKLKGVRQFIGFVGYYRRFVKDFAKLADPLVLLTRKGVPFVWGSDQQSSFDALKASTATVHRICGILSPICKGFCEAGGPVGVANKKGCAVCVGQ